MKVLVLLTLTGIAAALSSSKSVLVSDAPDLSASRLGVLTASRGDAPVASISTDAALDVLKKGTAGFPNWRVEDRPGGVTMEELEPVHYMPKQVDLTMSRTEAKAIQRDIAKLFKDAFGNNLPDNSFSKPEELAAKPKKYAPELAHDDVEGKSAKMDAGTKNPFASFAKRGKKVAKSSLMQKNVDNGKQSETLPDLVGSIKAAADANHKLNVEAVAQTKKVEALMAEQSKQASRAAANLGEQAVDATEVGYETGVDITLGRRGDPGKLSKAQAREAAKAAKAAIRLGDDIYESSVDVGTKLSGDALDVGLETTRLSQKVQVDAFCCGQEFSTCFAAEPSADKCTAVATKKCKVQCLQGTQLGLR